MAKKIKSGGGHGVPTVTVPVHAPVHAPAGKPKSKPKTPTKKTSVAQAKSRPQVVARPSRLKPKAKAKTKAKSAQPRMDHVPATMAPPAMEDTRPTRPTRASTPAPVQTPGPGPISVPPLDFTGQIVQGATCTWVGPLSSAPDNDQGVPVCPHCGGSLLTVPDRMTMELGLEQYELGAYTSVNPPPKPHPGYTEFMHWLMGQDTCWPDAIEAAVSYKEATGKRVDPSR